MKIMTITMTEMAKHKMWLFFKAYISLLLWHKAAVMHSFDGLVDENPSFGSDSIQFL